MKKPKKTKSNKPLTKEEYLEKLSARIKELRIKQGYTSYEPFSYDAGISRSQMGRYENGADIRFSNLTKIIQTLDISVAEFFSEGFD